MLGFFINFMSGMMYLHKITSDLELIPSNRLAVCMEQNKEIVVEEKETFFFFS